MWAARPSKDSVMLWAAASLFYEVRGITVPSESSFDDGAHVNVNDMALDSFDNPSRLTD